VEISIRERKFSWRTTFEITAGAESYLARHEFYFFRKSFTVEAEGRGQQARVAKTDFFRTRYEFAFADGRMGRFGCEKLWRGVYVCECGAETYRLYRHRGRRWSIFRDGRQIAACTKNLVVFAKGNNYRIRADHDADAMVLVCMMISLAPHDNDNQGINLDLGNLGPEERPFDESWEPR
jgi:uncharacterized protein YxjI